MRFAQLREVPLTLARIAFLVLLVAGMAIYGGTQVATQRWLEIVVIAIGLVYAHGIVISAQPIRIDPWILAAAAILGVVGWLSASHPASVLDFDLRLFLAVIPKTWWPWGTVVSETSRDTMRRVTGMFCALLMASDIGAHPSWRRCALSLMAWSGVAEAAFGLAHHIAGDIGNYWGAVGATKLRETVFGVFWYHGNAGAFLNLCWPLLVAITWREFSRPATPSTLQQLRRAIQVLGLLLIFSAIWINHSRAAQAVFLLQTSIALVMVAASRTGRMAVLQGSVRAKFIVAGFLILAIVVLGMTFGLDKSAEKWTHAAEGSLITDGRWAVLHTCSQWLGEVPALGFGPGTFSAVYLVKTAGMSDAPAGYWQFAHNDYLQTFFEWGWLGMALWTGLSCGIIGGLIRGIRNAARTESHPLAVKLFLVTLAFLSAAVHAMIDFPLQIFAIQLYVATLAGIGTSMAKQTGRRGVMGKSKKHKRRPHEGSNH
jgi:hypothetical protein